ncbi:MAG: hypothetical protein JW779_11900 [Candidatus Thorarchaeota archaeon]|nr:hypothetical protein [Candidatus Thorarchaeota archaeon]
MDFEVGFHQRNKAFRYMENPALKQLLELIKDEDYFPEESRKSKGGKRKSGVREIAKQVFNDRLADTWQCDVEIFDISSIPASKLHYLKARVGVVRSLQHRTTMGTDILRLEVAYRFLDIIDIGVFICGTSGFEKYYLGTEDSRIEHMVIFEELVDYLEMVSGVITVPIVLIGLKKPPKQRQTKLPK